MTRQEAEKMKANLNGADLSGAKGIKYAQCSFDKHGECGRQLTGVIIDGNIILFCGCFKGTPNELQHYIANGKPELQQSRSIAMEFIIKCLNL